MSNDEGRVLPSWIYSLKVLSDNSDVLQEFAENPSRYIRRNVAVWVVSGAIAVIEAITGRISWIFQIILDAVFAANDSVNAAFEESGDVILGAAEVFPDLLAELSRSLGPLAPVVVGVGGVVLMYLLWQGIKRAPGAAWDLYQLIPGT